MRKYSLSLKDVSGTIWIRAHRFEVKSVDDAFGNPRNMLCFFVGDFMVLNLYIYMIETFRYWPVLSDAKEIQL